jgi:phosphoglycolate phosphatase
VTRAVGRRFGHVFFDLDGTLVDPRKGIVGCLQYALEAIGEPIPEAASLERFIGPPLADTFGQLLGREDRTRIDQAIAAYRLRFGVTGLFENRVYDGIRETLRTLRASGRALWVVTAKPTVYSTTIVEHHGLRVYFRNVHGSELNGDRTDKGTLIRYVLETEGLSPRDVLMVGDRCHDVLGARANGVASVAVRWGYGSFDELTAARPDAIVESTSELIEYICRADGAPKLRGDTP